MTACWPRNRDSIAGFTLLEALIATALMAMILAAMATITAQWLPNWNRGFARVQRDHNLAVGLERLVADVAAAEFIPPGRDIPKPLFDGDANAITFVRSALAPNTSPGLEITRIAEIGDQGGPLLVRTRAPFEPVVVGLNDRQQPKFADPVVLLRPPFRISFAYAGADRVWRESWQGEPLLPRAIKLTLRDIATRRTLAVSTATLVHVVLPADCITAKSLAECDETHTRPAKSAEADKPPAQRGGQLQ